MVSCDRILRKVHICAHSVESVEGEVVGVLQIIVDVSLASRVDDWVHEVQVRSHNLLRGDEGIDFGRSGASCVAVNA